VGNIEDRTEELPTRPGASEPTTLAMPSGAAMDMMPWMSTTPGMSTSTPTSPR